MNVVESAIEFLGFRVVKAVFSITDEELREDAKIELNPTFTRAIQLQDDGSYSLILGIKIESGETDNPLPFAVEVAIEGAFSLEDIANADAIMKVNAVAILFPYLRSTLSMLTLLANITPIILPPINLVQMFEEEQAVTETVEKQE